jgi:hypothetical protein
MLVCSDTCRAAFIKLLFVLWPHSILMPASPYGDPAVVTAFVNSYLWPVNAVPVTIATARFEDGTGTFSACGAGFDGYSVKLATQQV